VTEALGPATPPLLPLQPLGTAAVAFSNSKDEKKEEVEEKKGLTYSQLLLGELPLLKGK
jgi:hypothetical protein